MTIGRIVMAMSSLIHIAIPASISIAFTGSAAHTHPTYREKAQLRDIAADGAGASLSSDRHERFGLTRSALPPSSGSKQSRAQGAPAFNLVCQGTEMRTSGTGLQEFPYERVFRIDLGSRRYCEGSCETTRPIANIEPTRITLHDSTDRRGFGSDLIINRESGGLAASSSRVDGMVSITTAQCRRAMFTGFPQVRF